MEIQGQQESILDPAQLESVSRIFVHFLLEVDHLAYQIISTDNTNYQETELESKSKSLISKLIGNMIFA